MVDIVSQMASWLEIGRTFAAVRVLGGLREPGTVLLVSAEEVCGLDADHEMREALAGAAREALAERKSGIRVVKGEAGEIRCFCEYFAAPETILIVGAGHIALPLCRMGRMMGFRVAVTDDREDYARAERFPDADEVFAGDFVRTLETYPIHRSTYVVLVTRGHMLDRECLSAVLKRDAAYIGMIGSARRRHSVFELLRNEGFSDELLARVHTPIGLPIGGETPEEIALSIVSEIVSVRRRGPAWALSLKGEFRKS